ncbi:MAG TPA: hypothetical protein VH575_28340 [Gemmataceae bacterium]|jgi:hypothetical protein
MGQRKSTIPPSVPSDNGETDALDFPFGANTPDGTTADGRGGAESSAGVDAPAAPDPFNPSSLRLSQDFAASLGVKKALLSVPVRKPGNSWFVRVHPDESYRLQTTVIELKEDRETYLVAQSLWPDLAGESTFSPRALFTAINRQGVLFLWPIRLPGADGRVDEWSRTALEAAEMAARGWVRVAANLSLGAYEVFQATGQLGEPAWPSTPFSELLRVAFKERFIDSLDHPVLRRLRGEA